jgi:hypothetical protein
MNARISDGLERLFLTGLTASSLQPSAWYNRIMRSFGKLLQVVGLVMLPASMVMQLTGGIRAPTGGVTVSAMLLLMVFGVVLFSVGRVIEGYAGQRHH